MMSPDLIAAIEQGFALHLDGIHGKAHWARVWNNGLRLAEQTGANTEVVELFAFLHDSKRMNDGHDPQHGARAARFAESLRDSLLDLPDSEFELLRFACEHHTDGLTEADITVQTCWDADRLDLGRIGIRPDPRRLCTLAAKESAMIEWAVSQSRPQEIAVPHELERSQFARVLPLFQDYLQDPMMHAVIEGTLRGRVWVDDIGCPAAALVWTGAECAYLAGGEENGDFTQALQQLVVDVIMPAAQAAGCEYLSLFSFPESYAFKLENLFRAQMPLRTPLSTFDFDETKFLERHGEPRAQPVAPLRLKRIGAEELEHPKHAHLAEQIAAYWDSVERFLDEGCGFCAVEGNVMVSWCYVQAYGRGAQTLDIWTAPSHRRQGLGILVGAAVIGASLEQGYTPFWICDRENVASRRLAERLGFAHRGDISLVDVPFAPHRFYLDLARYFFLPQGAHTQAAEAFDRAFRVGPGEAEDYYQAAKAWELAGQHDRAQAYMQKAIASGWKEVDGRAAWHHQ